MQVDLSSYVHITVTFGYIAVRYDIRKVYEVSCYRSHPPCAIPGITYLISDLYFAILCDVLDTYR